MVIKLGSGRILSLNYCLVVYMSLAFLKVMSNSKLFIMLKSVSTKRLPSIEQTDD